MARERRRRNPPSEFRPFAEITRDMGKGRPFSEYIAAVKGNRRRNPSGLGVGKLLLYGAIGYGALKLYQAHQATAVATTAKTTL